MLIEKLRNWSYYYDKLPLYLKNSYGFQDHFKLIYEIMMQLEMTQDDVVNVFDIMNDNYLNEIVAKYDDIKGYDFEFLDMIASIYGVSRAFDVEYLDRKLGQTVKKSLFLTNEELYILIKARIIQNNYDGSYSQAKSYYKQLANDLNIFIINSTNSAECNLYFSYPKIDGNEEMYETIKALFFAELLTLKSVGIVYTYAEVDTIKLAIWAKPESSIDVNNSWDSAVWA